MKAILFAIVLFGSLLIMSSIALAKTSHYKFEVSVYCLTINKSFQFEGILFSKDERLYLRHLKGNEFNLIANTTQPITINSGEFCGYNGECGYYYEYYSHPGFRVMQSDLYREANLNFGRGLNDHGYWGYSSFDFLTENGEVIKYCHGDYPTITPI